MTRYRTRGLVALGFLYALTAMGIFAFWLNWFASGAFVNKGDECFRVFENSFPLPDMVMAIIMILAASSLWRGVSSALFIGLFSAGMCLQLVSLDLLYDIQHQNLTNLRDPETWARIVMTVHCAILPLLSIFMLWRARRGLLQDAVGEAIPRMRFPVGAISVVLVTGIFSAMIFVYWMWHFLSSNPLTITCANVFHDAFAMCDAVTFASFALTALGTFFRRSWGMLAGIVSCGGITFGACIWMAFALLNPNLIEGHVASYMVFVGFLLTGAAAIISFLWSRRAWFLSLDNTPA